MEAPYSGSSGRTCVEPTTVWCGGCGIWFGSNLYSAIDAETDETLFEMFLDDGFAAINTCVCPSCKWRHVAKEPLSIHLPESRQIYLFVPDTLRHRAQAIRANFLASVASAPGDHVPAYVFEPILVGSAAELRDLMSVSKMKAAQVLEEGSSSEAVAGDAEADRSVADRSDSLNLLSEIVSQSVDEYSDSNGVDAVLLSAEGARLKDTQTKPMPHGVNGLESALEGVDVVNEGESLQKPNAIGGVTSEYEMVDPSDADNADLMFDDADAESLLLEDRPPESLNTTMETELLVPQVQSSSEDEAPASVATDDLAVGSSESASVLSLGESDVSFLTESKSNDGAQEEQQGQEHDSVVEGEMDLSLDSLDIESVVLLDEQGEASQDQLPSQNEDALSFDSTDGAHHELDERDSTGHSLQDGDLLSHPEENATASEAAAHDADGVNGVSDVVNDEPSNETQLAADVRIGEDDEGLSLEHKLEEVEPSSSGSVEIDPNYSLEIEAHSRPPADLSEQGVLHDLISGVPEVEQTATDLLTYGEAVEEQPPNVEVTDGQDNADVFELNEGASLENGRVFLRFALPEEHIANMAENSVSIVPQLHRFGDLSLCTLTVCGASGGKNALFFEPLTTLNQGTEILDALRAQYEITLEVYGTEEKPRLMAEFSYPLEENVSRIIDLLETKSPDVEEQLADRLVDEGDFEPKLSHNFERDSFYELSDASQAALALGILEFWRAPERFEPLWAKMGFPLSWWSGLEVRVLEAAYFFGLCPTLDNYEWARARLNQPSNGDYISGMIENFVEVCLRIRRSNLDVVALASNWDRLLHYAQLYQVQVDDEVEALALQTLEEAEMAAEDDQDIVHGSLDAIEISLADAMEVASIGGVNLADLGIVDRATLPSFGLPLDSENSPNAVDSLNTANLSLDTVLEILERKQSTHYGEVAELLPSMSTEDLLKVVPKVLDVADAFLGVFRGGLFDDSASFRLASAVFLAEVRDERGMEPLLAMVFDPDEEVWLELAVLVTNYGLASGRSALSRVGMGSTSEERIVMLLRILEARQSGTIEALSASSLEGDYSAFFTAAQTAGTAFEHDFLTFSFDKKLIALIGNL